MSKASTGLIMAAGIALAAVGVVIALTAQGSPRTDFGVVEPDAPLDLDRLWGRLRSPTAGWGLAAAGAAVAVAGYALRPRRRAAGTPAKTPAPRRPPPLP